MFFNQNDLIKPLNATVVFCVAAKTRQQSLATRFKCQYGLMRVTMVRQRKIKHFMETTRYKRGELRLICSLVEVVA